MLKIRYVPVLCILLLLLGCKGETPDLSYPVSLSFKYQPLEQTPKPIGTTEYLGLGPYAKTLCTAVFESGRDAEEAFHNSGKLILDEEYHDMVTYTIDPVNKRATVNIGDNVSRSATYHASQGCILDHPDGIQFTPVEVVSTLPEATSMDWPMGDKTDNANNGTYNSKLLGEAQAAAFNDKALTAAFLVAHKGNIILEHYDNGANSNTQLESWSMGKSLTATLIGRLIQQGKLQLDQKAPVPEWSEEGDPRGEITIRNLLQMSSGLRFTSHRDPEVLVPIALLDHMYIYTESINIFDFVVKRPLEFVPGLTGRYRNCDPITLGYIIRQTVEAEGRNYWTWPQEELFDKIGIRRQLLETDRYGNFILSGYDYGTARNWARLGLLYLNDGVWMGDRLLPEGYVDFVRTPATSWEDPEYGGMFWLNRLEQLELPEDAYYMAGGGGQFTIIVPSLQLVVVRMGHTDGGNYAMASLNAALKHIVEAIEE